MNEILHASFRDPSGFLFSRDGILYRQINKSYANAYSRLIESGLYAELAKEELIINHVEVDITPADEEIVYKIIKPDFIQFISYPYEWSFGLYKEAALATLNIHRKALDFGMILKDASSYNIQFHNGNVVLIDTLSFDIYDEGSPWVAYKQFCQHFLAPLALMAKKDIRLNQMMRVYIDGIPLDLASKLLPFSTNINFGIQTHIHLHSKMQTRFASNDSSKDISSKRRGFSKQAMIGLIESLENTIRKLVWEPVGTEWESYYSITNYSDDAFDTKKTIINKWIDQVKPESVWDMGANNGNLTRLASNKDIFSVAFDIDPAAVEQNYRIIKSKYEQNILPLLLDLTNPSPSIGWQNHERESLIDRAPADMVFALAIIHHLAISNNVPIPLIANFFYDIGKWLVIEFIPKDDSQVQKLLYTRKDIFSNYSQEYFEHIFGTSFIIRERIVIQKTKRTLYLMERKEL
jgi:hypothetical protein